MNNKEVRSDEENIKAILIRLVKNARQKKFQAEDIFADTVIDGEPLYN